MMLVTGATGTVGSQLVEQLTDAHQPVRVFVRDPTKVSHLAPDIERAVGNLDDPATIQSAVAGIESIFLLTSKTQQDIQVLQAARAAGVRLIVKLSTQEAGWIPVEGHGHMATGIASGKCWSRHLAWPGPSCGRPCT